MDSRPASSLTSQAVMYAHVFFSDNEVLNETV